MFSNVLLSHSLSLDMLNNFCFHVYAQKSLLHSLTLSLSHYLTLSLSHSLSLDMLNNFCFHVYAQKLQLKVAVAVASCMLQVVVYIAFSYIANISNAAYSYIIWNRGP